MRGSLNIEMKATHSEKEKASMDFFQTEAIYVQV